MRTLAITGIVTVFMMPANDLVAGHARPRTLFAKRNVRTEKARRSKPITAQAPALSRNWLWLGGLSRPLMDARPP